jgi:threonine/homoserine/homoserine lactone efflux protein
VLAFALIIAFAAQYLSGAFNKVAQFERWARRITGAVFIAVGIHLCLTSIFGLY